MCSFFIVDSYTTLLFGSYKLESQRGFHTLEPPTALVFSFLSEQSLFQGCPKTCFLITKFEFEAKRPKGEKGGKEEGRREGRGKARGRRERREGGGKVRGRRESEGGR